MYNTEFDFNVVGIAGGFPAGARNAYNWVLEGFPTRQGWPSWSQTRRRCIKRYHIELSGEMMISMKTSEVLGLRWAITADGTSRIFCEENHSPI